MLRVLRTPRSSAPPDAPASGGQDPLRDLVQKALEGDLVAERTLLMAVGPSVLNVVRSVLGASHPEVVDVCQDASLALLSSLPRFRGECTVRHFACRVALLTALNARRRWRTATRDRDDLIDPDATQGDQPTPVDLAEQFQRRAAVRRLLDELPWSQCEALSLHVVLGYTVPETAAAVGAPLNTVRSRLRRALSALRSRLTDDRELFEVIRGGR